MTTVTAPFFGVLAGLVGLVGTVPYVRDTVRRSTRPHRGTWLIWGVLAVVVLLSQRADGATWSLVMAGTHAVLTGLVFLLAIRLGAGGVTAFDTLLIAIAIAGAGLVGWMIAGEPIVATACVVGADLVAAGMMVPKTWRDPGSETCSTFVLASLGGAFAAASVGVLEPALLLYPVYYWLVNGALALLILSRRSPELRGPVLQPSGSRREGRLP